MIVKMNKYAYLVYHKEYDTFLEKLRSLGVVHVNHSRPTHEHTVLKKLMAEDVRVKTHLQYLDKLLIAEETRLKIEAKEKVDSASKDVNTKDTSAQEIKTATTGDSAKLLSVEECESVLDRMEDIREEIGTIQSSLLLMEKELSSISTWGDFKYSSLKQLRDAGYLVSFFTCPATRFNEEWETKYNAFIINNKQSIVYFITVTPVGGILSIDADRAKLPLKDYGQISANIGAEIKRKESLEAELLEIAHKDYASLKNLEKNIANETSWNNALAQTSREADEKLMFLEGWIPVNIASEMEDTLSKEGYYVLQMEVTDEDNVPIKLKNNSFTKLYETITKLYSLPNYKEFDPTPLFAPFFMLFFGLCFGDGGYGILLIVISLILRKKLSENMKFVASLVMYLGLMTLVIGTLTGSFFGISIGGISYFSSVKDYFLTSENLMVLSLVIGFLHVLFAKTVAAMKVKVQRGFKYSLSAFAWVFVILSLGIVFALPMMDIQLPETVVYALYGVAGLCGVIALFYNSPGKNIFINFGSGIWTTYNVVSGLLSDVLSYIRLYAIGLTGGLLGGVFNSVAIDMTASFSPFIRWLPMVLILLLGHSLNIGLGMVSSLVHPLRLVFVEYYKNSEFEGGGIDYKPFKKL